MDVFTAGSPLPEWPEALALIALLVVLAGAAWRFRTRVPTLRFGALSLVLFAPFAGAAFSEGVAFADRFTYVPALGLAIAVAIVGGQWLENVWRDAATDTAKSRRLETALGGSLVVIGLLAVSSVRQLGTWRDSLTLWEHAVTTSAVRSAVAHSNLGGAYLTAGRNKEARAELEAAERLDNTIPEIQNGLGLCEMREGNFGEARNRFQLATRLRRSYAEAWNNYAHASFRMNDAAETLSGVAEALAIAPDLIPAHENRALIYEKLGRWHDAAADWKFLTDKQPDDADAWRGLAAAYRNSGNTELAVAAYESYLRLRPDDLDARYALAMALMSTNRTERARHIVDDTLRVAPNFGPMRQLSQILYAEPKKEGGDR